MDDQALKNEILRISGVDVRACMRCGKCTATCPDYDQMEYHPHEFVYMVEKGEIAKLMASDSLYRCLSCMACVERCPRQVAPGKLIEAVRLMAERQKNGSHMNPDQIPALLDKDLPQQAIVSAMRKFNK